MATPFDLGNYVQSTVALAIASTDTSFVLASSAGFQVPPSGQQGVIRVDDTGNANYNAQTGPFEIMYYATNTTGTNTLSGLVRGQSGTTAHAFSAGATVSQAVASGVLLPLTGIYKARVHVTGTHLYPASTWTLVSWDVVDYDPNSNFSLTNNLYTCPVPGLYVMSGRVDFESNANRIMCAIYQNGTEAARGLDTTATLSESTIVATELECAAGDTLGLWTYVGTSLGTFAGTAYTYFTIRYVGP